MLWVATAATVLFILGASARLAGSAAAEDLLSPYARTGFVYAIGKRDAVLIGFVNPRGAYTSARFQVGTTKSYGRSYPPGEPERFYSGYHPAEVEEGAVGLQPGTTYHFRLVATSEGGTTYGKDKTFRTRPR